jgi:sulfur carrier protein ThiS
MQITINNESYTFDENTSLENAIDNIGIKRNQWHCFGFKRRNHSTQRMAIKLFYIDEDKIIIIGAVAGG